VETNAARQGGGCLDFFRVRNFKLVDERTGQLVAVFTREKSMSKCGRLQIKGEYGENSERMVLISCESI
jgi:hypothetical protein